MARTWDTIKKGEDHMRLRHLAFLVTVLFLAGAASVSAEKKFGVPVYPGAKLDTAATAFLKRSSPEFAAYRTNDNIAKVFDFYVKQAGIELIESNAEAAFFKRGDVEVTLESPWMDRKAGRMIDGTLISIRKHGK
jgi:hypothetical protein